MQELEKILEEIEIRAIKDLEEENDRCITACKGCCSDVEERKCNCRDAIIVRAFKKLAKCMIDGWISVEERLPEEKINPITSDYYEYQVTAKFGSAIDVRHYKFGKGHWWNGPGIVDEYVIAWKEPSDPYRPERSKGE